MNIAYAIDLNQKTHYENLIDIFLQAEAGSVIRNALISFTVIRVTILTLLKLQIGNLIKLPD